MRASIADCGISLAPFAVGALLLYVATRLAIPALASATGGEPVVLWFVAASLCLFGPLLLFGALTLAREGWPGTYAGRLRLRPMGRADWAWSLGGLTVVGLSTGGVVAVLRAMSMEDGLRPPFLAIEPLGPGRYWVLAAWLPFFLLNILGEEFVWRGVLLPRQEAILGRRAWLAHGSGWLVLHAAFPWPVLLALIPTAFVLPYVVQRRQNTWAGVVIHAGLNGPGFLALAFGLA